MAARTPLRRLNQALLTILSAATIVAAWPTWALAQEFLFATTKDFVTACDGTSPSEDCQGALLHVELVVNSRDDPNNTCDGGTDALLNAESNEELNGILSDRVVKVVAWLRQNTEYDGLSPGDGIWSALKGVYCR